MAPSVPQTYIHKLQIISCLPQLCMSHLHNCVLLFTGSTDTTIHAQASPASRQYLCHAYAMSYAEPNTRLQQRKQASMHIQEFCSCGEILAFMVSQKNTRGARAEHAPLTLQHKPPHCA